MNDCVDYIIETSNDEKISFLEAIEAISRSHKENFVSSLQQLDCDSCLNDDSNELNFFCLKESELKPALKIYSALKGNDDPDCLNTTDCDLNLLVDPRTGKGVNDVDECLDEFESACVELTTKESYSPHKCLNEDDILNDSETDDKKILSTAPDIDGQCIQKGNKTTLIQVGNSPNSLGKNRRVKTFPQIKSPRIDKYDKPPFSYSCLIAMALRSSESGFLPVSEIYSYVIERFPYFKTAPDGWKNSIRHNLSLNKCFQKLETPLTGTSRKACLWGLNEMKVSKLNEEITRWIKADPDGSGSPMQDFFKERSRLESWESDKSSSSEVTSQGNSSNKNSQGKQTIEHRSDWGSHVCTPFRMTTEGPGVVSHPRETKGNKIKSKGDFMANDSLFMDSSSQAWDDLIGADRLKTVMPHFPFSSDNSQSTFDSALSMKAVRASA